MPLGKCMNEKTGKEERLRKLYLSLTIPRILLKLNAISEMNFLIVVNINENVKIINLIANYNSTYHTVGLFTLVIYLFPVSSVQTEDKNMRKFRRY